MNPNKYFFGDDLNNTEENRSLGMLENMQFGWEISISSPVDYVTVHFKKVVRDQFHAGATLVESECIQRKERLSE